MSDVFFPAARLALPTLRGFRAMEEEYQGRCVIRHRHCVVMAECVFHVAQKNSNRALAQRRDTDLDRRSLHERHVVQ